MLNLKIQRRIANTFLLGTYLVLLGWFRIFQNYRISEIKRVRDEFLELAQPHSPDGQPPPPLLICANHLTLIDSMLIIWALGSLSTFIRYPHLFPWNLPERKNFATKLWLKTLCYLGKCVHVLRGGTPEETRQTLDQIRALFELGESVMIFPEGGRTRTGRVDTENFAYAVGRILQESPEARVLCVYLRGRKQENYSNLPARNDCFDVYLKLIRPTTSDKGLRGARDLSIQIIKQLAELEQLHFAQPLAHR